jgi:hypothetical protein
MAKKEYDCFVENPEKLVDGIISMAIRELTPDDRKKKYFSRYVKCQITVNPDDLPDGDILWSRYNYGSTHEKPFGIKILEELGAYRPEKVGYTA